MLFRSEASPRGELAVFALLENDPVARRRAARRQVTVYVRACRDLAEVDAGLASCEDRPHLQRVALAPLGPNDVRVRMEAAPINPSDMGLLFASADIDAFKSSGRPEQAVARAPIPASAIAGLTARLNTPLPVGNEGAGVVVAAGSSASAQALLGQTVAVRGGAMYAQFRDVDLDLCLVLPQGTTPVEAASSFVNPLTALGMVETMRMEGHRALVHTAAASNLGQMLNRICRADGIALVNIVRKQEQEDLLRGIGAKHVCNAGSPTFLHDLTAALTGTAPLAVGAIMLVAFVLLLVVFRSLLIAVTSILFNLVGVAASFALTAATSSRSSFSRMPNVHFGNIQRGFAIGVNGSAWPITAILTPPRSNTFRAGKTRSSNSLSRMFWARKGKPRVSASALTRASPSVNSQWPVMASGFRVAITSTMSWPLV